MDQPNDPQVDDRDERLEAVIAGYLEALANGEQPDTNDLIAAHPEFAEDLKQFVAPLR